MDIDAICRRWWGCIYDSYEHGTDDVKLLLDLIGPAPRDVFEVCCGTGRSPPIGAAATTWSSWVTTR